jgi:hypothetical protein
MLAAAGAGGGAGAGSGAGSGGPGTELLLPAAGLPQLALLQRGSDSGGGCCWGELAPEDFPLLGPLLQARVAAAGAAGRRGALAGALQAQAAACRQAGRLTEAHAALQQLQVRRGSQALPLALPLPAGAPRP